MVTTPLPTRTPANDQLISSTPYNLLTDRQKQYADQYGLTLLPASPAPAKGSWMAPGEITQPGSPVPSNLQDNVPSPVAPALLTGSGEVASIDPSVTDKAAAQRDAFAIIKQTLAKYGLPDSLADWAWQEILAGKGNAEIMIDLYQRPEFKAEFPEIDARQRNGMTPISPGEIIAYRGQATQLMRAAGLPPGFFDSKDDFAKFIEGDMSTLELQHRITGAATAMFNAPADLRAEAAAQGFGPGDLVAQWLNPDIAEPLLERQWTAAELSVAGKRSGWGGLSVTEATDMAQRGVTAAQAAQGFDVLKQSNELFNPLDGTDAAAISRQEQLSAVFGGVGSAEAQQRIERRRAERKAAFAGGGGFATTGSGVAGLGSAPRQ